MVLNLQFIYYLCYKCFTVSTLVRVAVAQQPQETRGSRCLLNGS